MHIHVYIKQVLSEKAKLAKKIREYNRKTTPVNHIHIKGAHCVSWIDSTCIKGAHCVSWIDR